MSRCLKATLVFAVIGIILYFSAGFILDKMGRYLYHKDELKPVDVIVILAGEETERVEYGVKLFKEGWARKDRIILAGGPVVWKYTWAALMREHAASLGMAKNAVLLEEKSRSTEEDALYTKEILKKHGYKTCIIVTSPYHSKRAHKIFTKVMGDKIKVISAPVEESWFKFDEWWKRRRDRSMVFNEYSKFAWLWFFGLKESMTKK